MPLIRSCSNCGTKNRIPAAHLADTGRCGSCKQPLAAVSEPIAADTALFDDIINNARVPVLVDFAKRNVYQFPVGTIDKANARAFPLHSLEVFGFQIDVFQNTVFESFAIGRKGNVFSAVVGTEFQNDGVLVTVWTVLRVVIGNAGVATDMESVGAVLVYASDINEQDTHMVVIGDNVLRLGRCGERK